MAATATAAKTQGKAKVQAQQPEREDKRKTSGPAKRAENLRLKQEAEARGNKKSQPKAKPQAKTGPQARTNPSQQAAAKGTPSMPAWDVLSRAAEMYKKIGDPTRLAILCLLKQGEMNVGAMCSFLGQSQPAVSHHLALLLHSRVVAKRRDGKNNIYRLASKAMAEQIENYESLATIDS
jgi:DNA-binding transcriptional ArsR family regulator